MVIKTEIISAALASVYLVQYIIMVVEFHLEVRITVCAQKNGDKTELTQTAL